MAEIIAYGDKLQNGCFQKHSTFANVRNFIVNEELTAISNNINMLAPNAIIFEGLNFKEINEIQIFNTKIILNNSQTFNFEVEKKYNSFLNFNNLTFNNITLFFDIFENKIKHLFPEKSLACLFVENSSNKVDGAFEKALNKRVAEACELFASKQHLQATQLLKGCGIGLTPSGDDFLAGVLFGLWFNQNFHKQNNENLRNNIYNLAIGRNVFSNNFLKFAREAWFFFRLKEFLLATFAQSKTIEEQAITLFSIGETSGADLLAGFYFTLKNKIGL